MTSTRRCPAGPTRARWSTTWKPDRLQNAIPTRLPSSTPNLSAGAPTERAHSSSAASASNPYPLRCSRWHFEQPYPRHAVARVVIQHLGPPDDAAVASPVAEDQGVPRRVHPRDRKVALKHVPVEPSWFARGAFVVAREVRVRQRDGEQAVDVVLGRLGDGQPLSRERQSHRDLLCERAAAPNADAGSAP